MGIFCTAVPGSDMKAETLATGRPVETGRKNGAVSVLLGHVVSAKTTTPFATDASMDYPRDWAAAAPAPSDLGHQERGRTIVLHSVAVLPRFQRQGLGRILMTSFMQQMSGAGIADRLVLIAHDVRHVHTPRSLLTNISVAQSCLVRKVGLRQQGEERLSIWRRGMV